MVKKIVLDTNVIVSAFGWKGSSHRIFQSCIDGDFQLFLSPPLLLEISKVLSYKKLNFNQEEIDEFMSIILETAEFIEPELTLDLVSDDPSDNRILECALVAGCEYIITGDRHLLKIKKINNIKIVSPDRFLKLI